MINKNFLYIYRKSSINVSVIVLSNIYSKNIFFAGQEHCPMSEKYHKNKHHLCLIPYTFAKLSQNMFLINTHIPMHWHTRCECKLWNAPRLCCVFQEFSYIIDDHLCLKRCIFMKLSLDVCLISVHILVCQHAKCDYC